MVRDQFEIGRIEYLCEAREKNRSSGGRRPGEKTEVTYEKSRR